MNLSLRLKGYEQINWKAIIIMILSLESREVTRHLHVKFLLHIRDYIGRKWWFNSLMSSKLYTPWRMSNFDVVVKKTTLLVRNRQKERKIVLSFFLCLSLSFFSNENKKMTIGKLSVPKKRPFGHLLWTTRWHSRLNHVKIADVGSADITTSARYFFFYYFYFGPISNGGFTSSHSWPLFLLFHQDITRACWSRSSYLINNVLYEVDHL